MIIDTVCPPTFPIRSPTGVCYFKSTSATNWNSAESSCRGMGGILAEPKNVQEHQTLNGYNYWIGIKKGSHGRYIQLIEP